MTAPAALHEAPNSLPDSARVREELRRRVDGGIRDFESWYRAEKGEFYLRAEERAVLRALELEPGATLIDAGCGGGRFTLLAARRCRGVQALDFSAVAAATTAERAERLGLRNVTSTVADITRRLPGEPADRVLAVQTIQHIAGAVERRQAVINLRQALRPGGKLVVTTFNGGRLMDRLRGLPREWSDPGLNWYYYYRFLASELAALLFQAGLRGVKVESVLHLPGRLYRSSAAAWLAPLDRALGRLALGRALGIYLIGSGWRR
jgi:cyclopropane fatty-acyl-phospholipid synthase-like methyltransferase